MKSKILSKVSSTVLPVLHQVADHRNLIYLIKINYLGWQAIRDMNTRGAPAIAITGCLALAVELTNVNFDSITAFDQFVTEKLGTAQI